MNGDASWSGAVPAAIAATLLLALTPLLPHAPLFHHLNDYLAAHQGVEIFAAIVASLVFAVGWNAHRHMRPANLSVLSSAFLAVAVITVGHNLSYTGMPDFITPSGAEKAIWFWLSLRMAAAIGLVAGAVVPTRPVSHPAFPYLVLVAALVWIGATYWLCLEHLDELPRTFISGQGLTTFKVVVETALIGVYFLAAYLFWLGRDDPGRLWAASASWVLGLSGAYFTFYNNPFDIYNQIGHLYNVAAYGMLYRGLVISTIRAPYTRLEAAQNLLEQRVDERTRDLKTTLSFLEDSKRNADRANQAKSDFLASMSHELRTPLNAVVGFAQLLELGRSGPVTEKQKKQLGHIVQGGRHLLTLINEILDLARIESGNASLSVEPVPPAGIMRECVESGRAFAFDRAVTVEDWSGAEPPAIQVDAVRFKQILLNLISNAVKYNYPGGRVGLTASRCGAHFRFMVSDTGPGIAPEKQRELFEPFNRLGAENTGTEGTGVGLTITKRLVEAMGGRVGFSSIVGEGSSFWIDVPVSENVDEASRAGESARTDIPVCKVLKCRILYVEDNPANVELFTALVESFENLSLVALGSAEEAVEQAGALLPDLIVMDVNLPGMSGIDAAALMRENPLTMNIPIIALSAAAMPDTVERALAAGMDRYLTKPLDVGEFISVVNALLIEHEAGSEPI